MKRMNKDYHVIGYIDKYILFTVVCCKDGKFVISDTFYLDSKEGMMVLVIFRSYFHCISHLKKEVCIKMNDNTKIQF